MAHFYKSLPSMSKIIFFILLSMAAVVLTNGLETKTPYYCFKEIRWVEGSVFNLKGRFPGCTDAQFKVLQDNKKDFTNINFANYDANALGENTYDNVIANIDKKHCFVNSEKGVETYHLVFQRTENTQSFVPLVFTTSKSGNNKLFDIVATQKLMKTSVYYVRESPSSKHNTTTNEVIYDGTCGDLGYSQKTLEEMQKKADKARASTPAFNQSPLSEEQREAIKSKYAAKSNDFRKFKNARINSLNNIQKRVAQKEIQEENAELASENAARRANRAHIKYAGQSQQFRQLRDNIRADIKAKTEAEAEARARARAVAKARLQSRENILKYRERKEEKAQKEAQSIRKAKFRGLLSNFVYSDRSEELRDHIQKRREYLYKKMVENNELLKQVIIQVIENHRRSEEAKEKYGAMSDEFREYRNQLRVLMKKRANLMKIKAKYAAKNEEFKKFIAESKAKNQNTDKFQMLSEDSTPIKQDEFSAAPTNEGYVDADENFSDYNFEDEESFSQQSEEEEDHDEEPTMPGAYGNWHGCATEEVLKTRNYFAMMFAQLRIHNIALYDQNMQKCKSQVVNGMNYEVELGFNEKTCNVHFHVDTDGILHDITGVLPDETMRCTELYAYPRSAQAA